MADISDELRVRRGHEAGRYDADTIIDILDRGYIAIIAFVHNDKPVAVPMIYWRKGDWLYWHGSTKSRAMLASSGDAVCVTVTHLDALVFARSAFHHSANYRSVMLFGTAETVPEAHKLSCLHALMERIAPGRDEQLRPMSGQELKATSLLRIPIDQASAKIKSGPPNGDPADVDWPVWEGVVPVTQTLGQAVSAGLTHADEVTPEHITSLQGKTI